MIETFDHASIRRATSSLVQRHFPAANRNCDLAECIHRERICSWSISPRSGPWTEHGSCSCVGDEALPIFCTQTITRVRS